MGLLRVIDTDGLGPLFLATVTALWAAHVLCAESGRGLAKFCAAVALIAYVAHAWGLKPVTNAGRVQEIILRSMVAAGFAFAAARFALTILIALWSETLGR